MSDQVIEVIDAAPASTDALVPIPTVAIARPAMRVPPPSVWQTIQIIAPTLHACRFYGVANPEQAATIMLIGYELGFGITGSFEFVHIVEGKPSLSPRGALAIVHASGELADWKMSEIPDGFACWMKRRNGKEYGLIFTLEDAHKAGIVKAKGAWETWPKQMCKWRCVGFVIDVLFPDLMGGMKTADQYGAVIDAEGNIIRGELPQ